MLGYSLQYLNCKKLLEKTQVSRLVDMCHTNFKFHLSWFCKAGDYIQNGTNDLQFLEFSWS